MEFKEPKVEIIKVEMKEVVFASNGQAGVESCIGSGSTSIVQCPDNYA